MCNTIVEGQQPPASPARQPLPMTARVWIEMSKSVLIYIYIYIYISIYIYIYNVMLSLYLVHNN